MKKNITIDNRTFEVKRSKYANANNLYRYSHRGIYQCYDRPSTTKVEIYHDWEKWVYMNDVEYFGIKSYNSNIFTLQGLINYQGQIYILEITPTRNTAYIPV